MEDGDRVRARARARAPGKIILSGEHAVVHGSTAVAAAIDLYTTVSVDPSSGHDEVVVLHLSTMGGLLFSWKVEDLVELVGVCSSDSDAPPPSTLISSLVQQQQQQQHIPIPIPEGLSSGISAFLHLYASILGCKPSKVTVSSDLPLGSGLGSSASFCVALAAALLLSSSYSSKHQHHQWLKPSHHLDLDLVNRWAFQGEKIIHGKPSGIDNTVSTFGNMIIFRSGEKHDLKHITSTAPLRMLITNTMVGRNTKALVAAVSERANRHPDAMASIFTAVNSISKELAEVIQSSHLSITQKEDKLQELMEMNQGLLHSMGVTHSSIQTVLRLTLNYKLSSKLTGAGGGGCVLTLLPTSLSSVIVDKVVGELEACGFQCLMVKVGGNGLEICFDDSS